MSLGFTKLSGAAMKPFFRASLKTDGTYELLIYEDIGENWWTGEGVTVKQIKQELDGAGNYSRIALRINSFGGDTFEGLAICNMLKAQGKPIDVYVDGLAASAASIIAMCGDTITMGSGAMMMVHQCWAGCIGNAADMQKMLNSLEAIDESIAQVYAQRTGMSASDCMDLMAAETWMTAAECVKSGFATAKASKRGAPLPEGVEDPLAMVKGSKLMERYAKVPKRFRNQPDPECACDCRNCQDDNCEDCSNESCVDKNCEDCPNQNKASAASGVSPIQSFAAAVPRAEVERGCILSMANRMSVENLGALEQELPPDEAGSKSILALRRFGHCRLSLAPQGDRETADRVTGLLVPYNSPSSDLGGFEEVYAPRCFNKWLAVDDQRVLAYHNIEKVLGRKSAGTARFWEEVDGLHYEADLPDTQAARDLRVLMQRGDVRESSAAFYILDSRWENRNGVRTRVVTEGRLVEGSPYSFPAYAEATAASVPAAENQERADFELELLRARHDLLMPA